MATTVDARVRCWYYQNQDSGMGCKAGDNCFFAHDHVVPARPPECIFYLKGSCRHGNDCIFFHDDGKGTFTDIRGNDNIPTPSDKRAAKKDDEKKQQEKRESERKDMDDGWHTTTGARRRRRRGKKKEKVVPRTKKEKEDEEEAEDHQENPFEALND
jgi:hypothetical protein